MSAGGLHRLRLMLDQLTVAERKIAEYILAHPQEAVHETAAGLGNGRAQAERRWSVYASPCN